ncbi:MAG TPA: protein kinase [Terriglobales bacterium]|nr:protein kinase [Terriglobales bacterium]
MKREPTFTSQSIKSGTRLGGYEILTFLGAGGMGEVYRAHDVKLGRDIALKILPAEFVNHPDRLARFRREARMLAALNHPNIATIYGLEQSDDLHYLVMELIDGLTLSTRLSSGPLSVHDLLDVSIQVASALDTAHSQGIIHRDIKPSNIVLTKKGQAKILDFGLAKLTQSSDSEISSSASTVDREEPLSKTDTLLGTIPYMSPEQVRGEDIDTRSDLFSFGLVIYEMATGRRAFTGRSNAVIYEAILNRAPVPVSQLNRDIPAQLEQIINRTLEKDRRLRHQTAGDLVAELQRLRRDVESGSSRSEIPRPQIKRDVSKKIGWMLGGAALAGLLWFLNGMVSPPRPTPTVLSVITNDGRQKELPYLFYPIVTDGARLYFTEVKIGDLRFAHVSTSGGETMLVDTPFRFPRMADISPDHSGLLVLGFEGSELEAPLWIIPILGGAPRRVGDLTGHDATWTPQGDVVYANGSDLYWAKADGSQARKFVSGAGIPYWLRWSPNGRVLRFTISDPGTDATSLWEVSADGSNPHRLLSGWNDPPGECCGNWSPDGDYFVFQSSRNGRSDIWVLAERARFWPRRKQGPWQLTAGPMSFSAPVFGGDGKKVFVIGQQRRGELVHYDARSHQFLPYLSGISADRLGFSPDGQWVAYITYPDNTLWRSKVDGTLKQQLTFQPLAVHLPRWSPDGTYIAFDGSKDGKTKKVYLISPRGGSPLEVLPGNQWQGDPTWSADGRSLAFTGSTPGQSSGTTTNICVVDLTTRQLSFLSGSAGLLSPRWSPDGRYVAATTMDSQKLMLFDTESRKWSELATVAVGYLNWSGDSKSLYFDSFGAHPSIKRVSIHGGVVEDVLSLEDLHRAWGPYGPWFGLAPDDSPLATRDVGSQELYAIQWPNR